MRWRNIINLYMYLEYITHVNTEGRGIRGYREPGAIGKGDLEAMDVVGFQNGDDLRVRMLAEPN